MEAHPSTQEAESSHPWEESSDEEDGGVKLEVSAFMTTITTLGHSNEHHNNGLHPTTAAASTGIGRSVLPLELNGSTAPRPTGSNTPVADLIFTGSMEGHDECSVIYAVTAFVQSMQASNPKLQLQGRHKGIRLNFDPDSDCLDITWIGRRIVSVIESKPTHNKENKSKGADTRALKEQREPLLQPLAYWNPGALPSVKGMLKTKKAWQSQRKHYKSAWTYFQPEYEKVSPIGAGDQQKVIDILMEGIRWRLKLVDPDHELLRRDAVGKKVEKKWTCVSNNSGFATALMACFKRDDLRQDEYEDLLEQELFRLLQRDPQIFYRGYKKFVLK